MKQPTKAQLRQTIAEQTRDINLLKEDNERLKERVNAFIMEFDPLGEYLPIEGELVKVLFAEADWTPKTARVANMSNAILDPVRGKEFIIELMQRKFNAP